MGVEVLDMNEGEGMQSKRGWMIGLGGVLLLIGLLGFYAYEIRSIDKPSFGGGRYYLDPMLSWPAPLLKLMKAWVWMTLIGLLLVFLGNGGSELRNWNHLFDEMAAKPTGIYKSVEAQLTEREVPGYEASMVSIRQGGVFSAKRKHLRVTRGYFRFDLYAAPFGKGFGVAWRCYRHMPFWQCAISSVPILGWLSYYLFFRYTTYVEDRGVFFQTVVHRCVSTAVGELTAESGVRALTATELEPAHARMSRSWN